MGILAKIMDAIFGEAFPPSSSDGDDGGWRRRKHNRTLHMAVGGRAEVIRIADERNRRRYDDMDSHIARLKAMAQQSRDRKARLRAVRDKHA